MSVDWDYSDELGPRCWGGLDPEFEACNGRAQSPIALWSQAAYPQAEIKLELSAVCSSRIPGSRQVQSSQLITE